MTNAMIILGQTSMLIHDGVIGEDDVIHTYARWKALGYQVKKGEKAITKFPVWKYTNKKAKEMDEEEAQASGYCFMKVSAFFSNKQVEPVK